MPQIATTKPHRKRKYLPIILVILALLIIAAVIGHAWVGSQLSTLNYQFVEYQAGSLNNRAKSERLQQYIQTAPPAIDQIRVYLQLGDMATGDDQPAAAYNDYLLAYDLEAGNATAYVMVEVARSAAASGNKATAIAFYYQAINHHGTTASQIDSYQVQIAALEKP